MSKKIHVGRKVGYSLLFIVAVINLYPFFFSVISSLKSNTEIFKSFTSLPTTLKWSNYYNAITEGHIFRYFLNTILLCSATIAVCGLVGSMASYILDRFIFKVRKGVYLFFIAGMMIPIQAVIIPMAYLFSKLHINNNYPVLILMYSAFSIPMTVLVLTGFIHAIPKELEEAAVIDGSSIWQLFFRVIFPVMKPGIISVSIFTFIQVWNNLLFPLIFISNNSMGTISTGLLNYFGERSNDYGSALAAITLTIIPVNVLRLYVVEPYLHHCQMNNGILHLESEILCMIL